MIAAISLAFVVFVSGLGHTDKFTVEKFHHAGIEAYMLERGVMFYAPEFRPGSNVVDDTDFIDKAIDIMNDRGLRNRKSYFEGHTDKIGPAEYNYVLGLRRATAVKDEFIKKGLKLSDIYVISYGETIPISNDLSKNRRVEVVLVNAK